MATLFPAARSTRGTALQTELTGGPAAEPATLLQESWRDFIYAEFWSHPDLERRARFLVSLASAAGNAAAAERLDGYVRGALAIRVDVTDHASTQAMAAATAEAFGGIDILINNAALMAELGHTPVEAVALNEWHRILAVYLTGAMLCSQAVIPAMRARRRSDR